MSNHDGIVYATADVPYEDFRQGLPYGRFRVVVNPDLATKYVRHRLLVRVVCLPLLGIGTAAALLGYLWVGIPLVLIGFIVPRVIRKKGPEILLYLARNDAAIYRDAIEYEILEVRAPLKTSTDVVADAANDA